MTTTWALGFYLLYECSAVDEKPSRWLLAGCYCFIGLSLLAKGLVGIVIPVGVLGLFHLVQRRLPRQQILLSLFWGLPLALIVAGSWYVPVTWRHGWLFIDQFFIQHHFARYVSNKYHHAQPAYYYLLVVPLLSLPWTLFLFAGLIQFILRLWRGKTAVAVRGDLQVKLLMSLTLAWFFCPLVFFSFSGSKLPGYVLPLLPAGALIVGKQLCELRDGSGKWLLRATAFAYVMFALGVVGYSWRTGTLSLICAFLLAAPLLAAGCFPFLVNRKASASVALMAGMTVVELIAVMFCVAPRFAEFESSRRLLQLADARGYSQATVYGIQRSDRTPEFYAAGRVVYGSDGEPIMYEGPAQVIYECRKRNEVLLAFVPIEDVGSLTAAADVRAEVIGDNTRYAIVAVRSR
jgi:4-amino-4-deoxy-L-arabinose transferase-like glycosyltransferase